MVLHTTNISNNNFIVVLIYVGIRMAISTVASDQAKYKNVNRLGNEFCNIILLGYIILFTLEANNALVGMLGQANNRVTIGNGVVNTN